MLLSDLLGRRVVDDDHVPLGRLVELLLVQDGPLVEGFGHSLRVDGVAIADHSLGITTGASLGVIRGPRSLVRFLRHCGRDATYAAWADLLLDETGPVRLRPGAMTRPLSDVVLETRLAQSR
jgi:hypothetical protein